MINPDLIHIAGASFTMGSDEMENERPPHRVRIDAFELAACQVTNADYALFLQSSDHPPPPWWDDPALNRPRQPVVGVSWLDAARYCDWITDVRGRPFRLPTEAEWELAARGGAEGARYPWGNEPPESRPGYADRWLTGPEDVGCGTPNAFGLHDICENIHEWCSDWYAADYYLVSPERNPHGPEHGARRVSRGGSWRHRIKVSRCAARSSLPPDFRYADYGFRVAGTR